MENLSELLADPEFQALSYEEQQITKDIFFKEKMSKRADIASLGPYDQMAIYKQVMNSAPSIEGLGGISLSDSERLAFDSGQDAVVPNAEYKKAVWLRERAELGDADAQNKITQWITTRRVANETLVGQAVMGSIDALQEVFGGDSDPMIARNKSNLSKISNYLLNAQTPEQAATTEAISGIASIGGAIVETIALNSILVGAATGRTGLLTGKLFQNIARAGEAMNNGWARAAWTTLVPMGVEAVGGGAIDVLRSLPQIVQDSSLTVDKQMASIAQTFGEGVVFDLAASAALNVVGRTMSDFAQTFRKMDVTNEASIEGAMRAADWLNPDDASMKQVLGYSLGGGVYSRELFQQWPESIQKKLIKEAERFQTTIRNFNGKPGTPEGFRVFALAGGFDSKFNEAGVQLFKNDELVRTFATAPEAASYISKVWQNATIDSVMDDFVKGARRSLDQEAKVVRKMKATVNPKDLSNDDLMGLLAPNTSGVMEKNNVLAATRGFLRKAGVTEDIETLVVPNNAFFKNPQAGGLQLRIPDAINTPEQYKTFLKYYEDQMRNFVGTRGGTEGIRKAADLLQGLSETPFSTNTLSPYALQAAGQKLGVKVQQVGSQFVIKTPGNAPQTFESIQDANQALSKYAFDNGLVDNDSFEAYLKTKSLELRDDVDPATGVTLKTVRHMRSGEIVERGEDIQAIMTARPDLVPKLPESLAPNMTFVGIDDTVSVSQGFISGSESDMRKMLDSFGSANKIKSFEEGIPLYTELDGTTVRASGKSKVELQVPSMGFRKEFNTFAEAKKFLKEDMDKFETMVDLAAERGIRLDLMPNGQIAAKELNGRATFVRNLDELKKVLKETPDPELQPELVRMFGNAETEKFTESIKAKLATDTGGKKFSDYIQEKRPIYSFYNKAYSFFAPMRDTLERVGKATGLLEIPQKAREYDSLHRQFVSLGRRGSGVVEGLFKTKGKPIDKLTDRNLATLLELPESKWAEASKAINFDLTEEHIKMLHGARAVLNNYGRYFGIDMNEMVMSYAPKLRNYYLAMQKNPEEFARFTAMSKQKMVNEALAGQGAAVKQVEFFARHASLNAFLTEADTRSIRDMMNFYIKQGLYEKLLGKSVEDIGQWVRTIQANPAVSKGDLRSILSYYESIIGASKADATLADLSLTASAALSQNLKKLTNKFVPTEGLRTTINEFLDDMVTTDVVAKANSLLTYATLGFRPIRGLMNSMQFMNVQAIFGDHADKAVRVLSRDKGFTYAKSLFDRGILDERVFASASDATRPTRGIFELSLRGQQNSEYLVRARTAMAAELSFDSALKKYSGGIGDFEQFVKNANLDILTDDAILQVKELMSKGEISAARDLFQRDAVRITMFDYGKENYPLLFKGTLGRLFGKFGVYPVGQIAMYQRIASRGDPSMRILRGARFLAYSTATYEAFKMAGIDYSGFLFYDPFTFTGGPLFTLAQDALNARDTGPQGAIARKNLVDSWRLFVPFSFQANKMLDAIESGANGEIQKAMIEAMSSKYTPDNLLNGWKW